MMVRKQEICLTQRIFSGVSGGTLLALPRKFLKVHTKKNHCGDVMLLGNT